METGQEENEIVSIISTTEEMKPEEAKEVLKRITDEAIGITSTFVEATLEPGEYYIYTEVWQLTTEQLDKIRSKVTITSLSVDGGRIMLTAKYKTMEKKIREEESAA